MNSFTKKEKNLQNPINPSDFLNQLPVRLNSKVPTTQLKTQRGTKNGRSAWQEKTSRKIQMRNGRVGCGWGEAHTREAICRKGGSWKEGTLKNQQNFSALQMGLESKPGFPPCCSWSSSPCFAKSSAILRYEQSCWLSCSFMFGLHQELLHSHAAAEKQHVPPGFPFLTHAFYYSFS